MNEFKAFYFMRHGETDWNHQEIYMGSSDIPLNQTGLDQATDGAGRLKDHPIISVVASPLKRALKTAEIAAAALDKPVTLLDELKECHWGVQEGQPVKDEIFERWLQGDPHKDAETREEFDARVAEGFKKASAFPGPVLIVAHSGVFLSLQRVLKFISSSLPNGAAVLCTPHNELSWTVEKV